MLVSTSIGRARGGSNRAPSLIIALTETAPVPTQRGSAPANYILQLTIYTPWRCFQEDEYSVDQSMAVNEILSLHEPIPLGDNWQGIWFNAAHEHTMMYSEGYFYVLWHREDNPTPRLFFHKSDLRDNILLARMSLNKELIAIQTSSTSLLVVDVTSRKTWVVDIRSPVDSMILPGGVIWSDHGGSSQDLILVTNKGMELFKVTSKRVQCKLSRVVSQPAMAFWYNPRHRMIMFASYQRLSSKNSRTQRDVLLMDSYFFKTERSPLPTLELPPPDKAPRFEIGPGISSENVHLVSAYGHALALVHYSREGEDVVTVYSITKSTVDRVHCLSLNALGPVPPASLRVSTLDNLVFFHSMAIKQTLIFDLMTSVRSKQSAASIDQLEPMGAPCVVCAIEDILDSSSKTPSQGSIIESQESQDLEASDWQAVAALPLPADLRDFSTLRFAPPARLPSKSKPLVSSTPTTQYTRIRLKSPRPLYAFYFPPAYDVHHDGFAFDRETRTMWRLSCNILALASYSRSSKEKVRFLCRRGRVYDFPAGNIWPDAALLQTKYAKHALMKGLLDMLQSDASAGAVHDYMSALLGPYISEHRRLLQVDELVDTEGSIAAQSKALQAMDLAQSPARVGNPSGTVSRRASLADLLTSRIAASRGARVAEGSGVLDLLLDLSRDQLEPFGLSSSLFSDISSLGMKAKFLSSDTSRMASSSIDRESSRCRSRSLKPVHDCTLLQLRRDGRGDLVITQSELVSLVWVPFLLQCRGEKRCLWTHLLTEFMAQLAGEDIARTSALSVLHLNLLFSAQDIGGILNNLRMHLYSDTVETAFMLLQFADLLGEGTGAGATVQAPLLAKAGIDMLWRLNEKTAAVKYLLSKGRVNDAIDICRLYGGVDAELSCRFLSGIEFFSAAAKLIEEGDQRDPVLLLFDVYSFLVTWDGAVLTKPSSSARSRLATATTFPASRMPVEAENEFRALFGFSLKVE